MHVPLRMASLEGLAKIGFQGIDSAGFAVGRTQGERERMLDELGPTCRHDRPRYLMGVGTRPPNDLLSAVKRHGHVRLRHATAMRATDNLFTSTEW